MLPDTRHHRFGLFGQAAGEQQGELVTTKAESAIDPCADNVAYRSGQLLQHQVACVMPGAIIDLLEVVEVDVDKTQRLL